MGQMMPPPPQSAAPNKSIWKRWWFWVGLVLVLGAIGSLTGDNADKASTPVHVSTPSPEITNPVETSEVPDLMGLSLTKATALAQQTGFEVEVEEK